MIDESSNSFTPQMTADGSQTFFSQEFGELFHSHHGAKQEAELKFVQPTQLTLKAQQSVVSVLDICYGLGYNTAAAIAAIWQVNPHCLIEWIGLESNVTVPKVAIEQNLLDDFPESIRNVLAQLAIDFHAKTENFNGQLLLGDARQTIQQVRQLGFLADAIFLDPFSPPNCPQLWTVEFLGVVTNCLKPSGYLATYSCSAAVRTALMEAGLNIGSTSPVGRKSPGTVASFSAVDLPPLSLQEQEHLQTRAAIPYRDPSLADTSETLLQRRQQEQQISSLEPTSRWKKRWVGSGIS
jgi:tRNA U34 5-methylaminomethyl-2-thiouridine-forming methyltransferase MnmC